MIYHFKWFISTFEIWRSIQLFTHPLAATSSLHVLSLATRSFASFYKRKSGFKRNGNCFLPPLTSPVPSCLYCRSLAMGAYCSLPCLYKRWVATQIFAVIFEWERLEFYAVSVNPGRSKYAYCSKDICSLCYIWAGVEALPRIECGWDAKAFSLSDNFCLCMDSYCAKKHVGQHILLSPARCQFFISPFPSLLSEIDVGIYYGNADFVLQHKWRCQWFP